MILQTHILHISKQIRPLRWKWNGSYLELFYSEHSKCYTTSLLHSVTHAFIQALLLSNIHTHSHSNECTGRNLEFSTLTRIFWHEDWSSQGLNQQSSNYSMPCFYLFHQVGTLTGNLSHTPSQYWVRPCFAFRAALILHGKDSTRCWKHSSLHSIAHLV